MTNVLILDASILSGCGGVIGLGTLQGLDAGHFIVANHQFAFLQQFSGTAIELIDQLAFDLELLILSCIQPVATLVRSNRGFFLKDVPHGEAIDVPQSLV